MSSIAMMSALALAIGYGLGSLPFGVILTRLAGVSDPRSIGSGNVGATNVLRTGRKDLAALTLILDALKGAVAVWIGAALAPDLAMVAGLAAFIGHLYPVWLGFKGGKGVATMFGVVIAASLWCGLIFALVWIAVLAFSRYSSLAGLTAAMMAPVSAAFMEHFELTIAFLAMAMLIIWKHRDNIGRLLRGDEPRLGGGAKPAV